MERKGFTLIELIFVIVIIGVLAAVAIPKFQNLKQHAEVNNLFKIVTDMSSIVPETYLNMSDLEGEDINSLEEIVNLKGKNWTFTNPAGNHLGIYTYNDGGTGDVATIQLDNNRTLEFTITCANFKDSKSDDRCQKLAESTTYSNIISW